MANKIVIDILVNGKQADNMMKQIEERVKAIDDELQKLASSGQGKSKRAEFLKEEANAWRNLQRENQSATTRIKNALADLGTASVKSLRAARNEAIRYRDSLAQTSPEFQEVQDAIRKLQEQIDKGTGKSPIGATAHDLDLLMDAVKNLTSKSINELNAARDAAIRFRNSLKPNDPFFEDLRRHISTIDKRISEMSGKPVGAPVFTPANDFATMEDAVKNLATVSTEQLRKAREAAIRYRDTLSSTDPKLKEVNKSIEQLTTQINKNTGKTVLDDLDEDAKKASNAVNRLKQTSVSDLRAAREAAIRFRDSLAESDPRFASAQRNVELLNGQIASMTGTVEKHGSAWRTTVRNMMTYAGVFGTFNLAKQKLQELVQLNFEFSDQLADVRKVSGLTMKEINNLAGGLAKIDTRTSIQELMRLSYEGAKLGFGDYGTEVLESFTRAANVVNVALKEELGDDALTALSKIVENMGLLKKMGVEQSMLKTGSAMFKLAASSTASANNIVEFSKRLTAMARVAGITTDQLLALGSASDSMYLAPEVAATAFTKLFSSLQTNHNLIEKTLKIDPGTINQLFSAGNAMDAIVLIFERMHAMGNMNALKPVFKDLGSDGARLMNVMVAMAKNVDMLKKHLDTSKHAFEEGTAVVDEYNIQQNTANALRERANNLWVKALVNPEEVDTVRDFAQAWYDFSKYATGSSLVMFNIKTVLTSVLFLLRALLAIAPSLLTSLSVFGLVRGWTMLSTSIFGTTIATEGLAAAWGKLNMAMKASIITFVLSAVLQLGMYIYDLRKQAQAASETFAGFGDNLREANAQTEVGARRAKYLADAINRTTQGTAERAALIRTFNKEYGQYLNKMLQERDNANTVAAAYKRVVEQLKAKLLLEAKSKDIEEYVNPRVRWEVSKLDQYQTQATASGSPYDSAYARQLVETGLRTGKTVRQVIDQFNAAVTKVGGTEYRNILASPAWNNKTYAHARSFAKTDADNNSILLHAFQDYARQAYSTVHTSNRIDKMYRPYDDLMNSFINSDASSPDEPLGSLDNDATDKGEQARLRRERAEAMRRSRDAFKNAKEQATAVISAIEEYYTLQGNAAEQMFLDGKVTRIQADNLALWIKKRKEEMLKQARYAIGGRDNNFDELRKQMGWGNDRLDLSSGSDASMRAIQSANPAATRAVLMRFDGKDGAPDGRAVIDDINKKAAENDAAILKIDTQMKESVEKFIKQGDYVLQAQETLARRFTEMGVVFENPASFFSRAASYHKEAADQQNGIDLPDVEVTARAPQSRYQQMLSQFISEGPAHYGIDADSATGIGNWLRSFATGGDWQPGDAVGAVDMLKTPWARAFPQMDQWLGDIPKYKTQIQAFYMSLMQYEDEYYDAQRQAYERDKKLFDERWNRSGRGKTYERMTAEAERRNREEKLIGNGAGATREAFQREGFADTIAADPEVMRYRLQMQLMQEKLDLARQVAKDEQTIRDAERARDDAYLAYAERIYQSVQSRIGALQEWMAPIEQFGTAAGDAFAAMTADAEKGRQQLAQALRSMGESFGRLTIKMITEQLTMRLQRSLFNREMEADERRHGERMTAAKEEEHTGVLSKVRSFFASLFSTKKKQQKQEIKLEQGHEKQKVDIVDASGQARLDTTTTVETGIANVTQQMGQKTAQAGAQQAAEQASTTATQVQGDTAAGIASGSSKIISRLGWWGIPLIAVITALLNGLLQFALGKLGKGSSDKATVNTKLVTGMLTYDSGNLQMFRGVNDGKSYPVVGNDGRVYAATDAGKLSTGLVNDPITTLVNGQPALVAERGPEIVIGRETTAAVMMTRPDILRDLIALDNQRSGRTYRAYDSGNVGELASGMPSQGGITPEQLTLFTDAINAFVEQTKKPLKAAVNKWEMVRQVEDGMAFKKRYD